MDLQQILLILIGRYKVVLLVLVATVAVTFVGSLLLPWRYTAIASVVMDVKRPDPIASVMLKAGIIPNVNLGMATEVDIIKSQRVARRVVKILKLDEDEKLKQQWIANTDGQGRLDAWVAELLLKKLTVKQVSLQSSVLPIKFVADDPEFAAAAANAFAQAYIEVNTELKVEPAKHYVEWFAQQEKSMREALEKAHAKVSTFQKEKGIVAGDELKDNETLRLNELSQQLSTVQGQTTEALSKRSSGDAADTLPEISQHPLLSSLKSDIARQEGKLKEAAGNLGKNHPQYQRMESEIATLKEKLRIETRHITSGFSTSQGVGKNREAELRAAIEAQKRKLLQLKTERDQLAVLKLDVDAAKKALDAVATRFQQSNLDSQASRTNVSVLTTAVAPAEPSFPKLMLFTLLAIPAGALYGAAAAYALEMHDRCIRSAEDLAETLQSPVLAVIAQTRPQSRLVFWRRKPVRAL